MVAPGIKRVFAATWFKIKFLFFFFINLAFVTWLWLQLMNVKTQLIMLSNHLDVNVCLTYSGGLRPGPRVSVAESLFKL